MLVSLHSSSCQFLVENKLAFHTLIQLIDRFKMGGIFANLLERVYIIFNLKSIEAQASLNEKINGYSLKLESAEFSI